MPAPITSPRCIINYVFVPFAARLNLNFRLGNSVICICHAFCLKIKEFNSRLTVFSTDGIYMLRKFGGIRIRYDSVILINILTLKKFAKLNVESFYDLKAISKLIFSFFPELIHALNL